MMFVFFVCVCITISFSLNTCKCLEPMIFALKKESQVQDKCFRVFFFNDIKKKSYSKSKLLHLTTTSKKIISNLSISKDTI